MRATSLSVLNTVKCHPRNIKLIIIIILKRKKQIHFNSFWVQLKDESLALPGSGWSVVGDVIVSSVVVETDFDAVTADIVVESGALVSIGVI